MKTDIKKTIIQALAAAVKNLEVKVLESQLSPEHPAVESHGDWSSNIALTLFPSYPPVPSRPSSPCQLAETIVDALS